MGVYIDELKEYPVESIEPQARRCGLIWCHLWASPDAASIELLHQIAKKAGMKKQWFQNKRPDFPHYDLVPNKRAKAIAAGAVPTDLREYIRKTKGMTIPIQDQSPNLGQLPLF